MKQIDGGVTAAKGFEAAATAAKIKYEDRDDLALLYSDTPCIAAGTFTTNVVKAAPVIWDKTLIEEHRKVRAVVVNSGIANACTGKEGLSCCKETAKAAADTLQVPEDQVAVCSTGIIGESVPVDKIAAGLKDLAAEKNATKENATAAAAAMMTTDTHPKEAAVQTEIDDVTITIGGMSKGSGMIHPNMCTMLAFLTTDAEITQEALQMALDEVVADTFNMISVDGDTSTNDTVLLLSSRKANNPTITEGTELYDHFKEALMSVCQCLARQMAADGEGAHALLTVTVIGCESKAQAKLIARTVVSSNLVKTAVAGHDANWGRILCAMGYAGTEFDPDKVDLFFKSEAGTIQILKNGRATGFSEQEATKILSGPEVTILADLKMGDEEATAWGCDLTHDYISINADYRS